MVRQLFLLLGLALLFESARADVLVLANNDRLTGTLIREENGTITFLSPVLGEITVASSMARLESPPPPRKIDSSYTFKPLDLRTVTKDPGKALKAERVAWVRRLEFGFTSQSGRTEKTDLVFNFEAGRRGRNSETRFAARYLFGESGDQTTTDLMESSLRLRRNLSTNTFAQSSTRVSRDAIKELDLDGEQGFGLGRNILNRDSVVLAIGAGAAARYRDEVTEPPHWDYLVDGFQDLRYDINSRLSLAQDLSMVVAPANRDDYKLRLNTALTGKVTETVSMSMRYEYEYDRSLDLDVRDNQRIVTSVVYVF